MHIGFWDIWYFVVDDVFELIHVDTTCGDIRRDEDTSRLILEVIERSLSRILPLVSMDSLCLDIVL